MTKKKIRGQRVLLYGEKMSSEKKVKRKSRFKRVMVTLFCLTLTVLFVILYVLPSVIDAFRETSILYYGGLVVSEDATCYIIRDEVVYFSNQSGIISYHVGDATKVRKNTRILDIAAGPAENREDAAYNSLLGRLSAIGTTPETYTVPANGTTSYFLDGREGTFSPATMEELTKKEVEKMDFNLVNVVRDTTLLGEPLFKMVDDTRWYVIFWVEPENIARYTEGNSVTVKMPLGDVKGVVHSVTGDEGKGRIIVRFNRSYKDFLGERKVEATVVTEERTGLIVENSSIAVEEGYPGVYVKDVSGIVFRRVKIVASDGEYSIVESNNGTFDERDEAGETESIRTVKIYDEILKVPELNKR